MYLIYNFRIKTMFGSSLPPVVCRRAHVLFTLLVFVWCLTHIVLCFYFICLRVVYPMLPVSLDCSFLIVSSVFSNVYIEYRMRFWNKKSLKIPKGQSESVYRRRTDNTMAKRKSTKGQTTIYKTYI
jgi:hypothetical protein